MAISKEFSEILGFLCAEGCYVNSRSSYTYLDKKRNKIVKANNKLQKRIEFGNKNKILLDRFQSLLAREFNYSPRIGSDRICICKYSVVDSILNQTPIGHLKWRVPEEVKKSDDLELIKSFIRGYFEGDGTISNRLRLFSTNYSGLKEVSELLTKLNINHNFKGPYVKEGKKDSFEIYVFEREKLNFIKQISPITKKLNF